MKKLKSESGIRFGPALKAFFLCFLIAGSAVGYVWQKSQIYQLGREIHQQEVRLSQLKGDDQRLTEQLAIMRSPMMLDERAKALNLGLAPAQPGQVYCLPEPVLAAPENSRTRQLAGREAGGTLAQ